MIKLRLSTADKRQQLIVDEEKTPLGILQDNSVIIEGASINLDGIALTREELNSPLSALVYSESATLSVVVKSGNA